MAAGGSLAFVVLSLTIAVASATIQVQKPVTEDNFSYSGSTGPGSWSGPCSTRKDQSPIDIIKKQAVLNDKLAPLDQNYSAKNATLINYGHSIAVLPSSGDFGTLVIDGKTYNFQQFHWHTPSEHRINGIQYPAESHLKHKASDGTFAVVAVLYDYGKPDAFISKISTQLKEMSKEACRAEEDSHFELGTVDPNHLRRKSRKYFRYGGSTTTPPCTGTVTWTILNKVRSISKEQVEALKAPLRNDCKNNDRPVQPLNGRQVQVYDRKA